MCCSLSRPCIPAKPAARSCVAPFYRWLCLGILGRTVCLEGSPCLECARACMHAPVPHRRPGYPEEHVVIEPSLRLQDTWMAQRLVQPHPREWSARRVRTLHRMTGWTWTRCCPTEPSAASHAAWSSSDRLWSSNNKGVDGDDVPRARASAVNSQNSAFPCPSSECLSHTPHSIAWKPPSSECRPCGGTHNAPGGLRLHV